MGPGDSNFLSCSLKLYIHLLWFSGVNARVYMFVCVRVSLDAFPSISFGNAHLDMTRLDSPLVVFFKIEYHLNVIGVVKARRPQISLLL